MIQVENLSFSYQNNKVFKNLSFSIKKGEYLCIIGKNGSGKSTLAKLLAGLIFQQEGNIKISGYDAKNKKDLLKIRKLIGIIFQNPENQIITTSVFDEVVFGLENLATPRENIKEIAEKSLKSVSLLEYKDRLTYQLSGGEKQRLAIASVLAMGTEILIFDEATSMLDPIGKKHVLKHMKELNSQGKTIIHITHNRNDILEASEVILLSKGEIKYQGNPYRIFEDDDFNPFLIKIKNILEKNNIRVDDKNINMEDLVRLVYENIS
ncbi:ATP-binding cassette domain-containing protein [Fusobacterium vincentii]|uniref:ATP-binding cassette domain-containing protein n=1 Tax=Fusobacterium vincentii TaxID=155615 RepID=UPI0030CE285F